ncbi:MAG: hypothetical protein ACE5HA_07180 [Anaerolineae bacterium]
MRPASHERGARDGSVLVGATWIGAGLLVIISGAAADTAVGVAVAGGNDVHVGLGEAVAVGTDVEVGAGGAVAVAVAVGAGVDVAVREGNIATSRGSAGVAARPSGFLCARCVAVDVGDADGWTVAVATMAGACFSGTVGR